MNDRAHAVRFAMNDWTGRFTLTVDGAEIAAGRLRWADQWAVYRKGPALFRFALDGAQAAVAVSSAGMTWKADFAVDPSLRADPRTLVLIPEYRLPPWWAFALAGVTLAVFLVLNFSAPGRRVPVAALGLAGAAVIVRFSSQWSWPFAIRVALAAVASVATILLGVLSAPGL